MDGIVTSNYFDVLNTVEFEFDCSTASLGDSDLHRFQIVPRKIRAPDSVKSSKESSRFTTKHHTDVMVMKEPTPIQEVVSELTVTEETANLQLQPTHLAAADALSSHTSQDDARDKQPRHAEPHGFGEVSARFQCGAS